MGILFSDEVAAALADRRPVVALETSVIVQGLPYPENLEAARACEEAVRAHGAIPAPIAVADGQIHVGLMDPLVRRLAEERAEQKLKIASRDLPFALATRGLGGTTVSAACEIAAKAGIRVFATGGIGGVHRAWAKHPDVSQDLWALVRFPIAVVCAGAKAILDLSATLEALEALAIPVVGVGTRELPAFYCDSSGLALEQHVEDAAQGARMMRVRWDALGQQGGMLFTLPPPSDSALPRAEVEDALRAALAEAKVRGVNGKALTPFLLAALAQRTGGRALRANIALLAHNAAFAADLAVAYAAL